MNDFDGFEMPQHILDEFDSVFVGKVTFFVYKILFVDSTSVCECVFVCDFISLKNIRSIAKRIAHMKDRALSE